MENLELKHLAPYLPYGLKVRVDYYSQHEGRIFNFSPVILLDFSRDEYIVKPILRPLSDLTKEIEHDGEKFVPIDKIRKSMFFHNEVTICNIEEDYKLWCVREYELLIEWHFDIYGLIEKGLAIDINTLHERA